MISKKDLLIVAKIFEVVANVNKMKIQSINKQKRKLLCENR